MVSILYWRCHVDIDTVPRSATLTAFQFSIGDATAPIATAAINSENACFNSLLEMHYRHGFEHKDLKDLLFQFSIGDD